MMRLPHRSRAGLALLEVVMLLLALTLAMSLGIALLTVALKANGAAATALQGLTAQPALADRFRKDVAGASAVHFPPERENGPSPARSSCAVPTPSESPTDSTTASWCASSAWAKT